MQTDTLERPVRRNHRLKPSYENAFAAYPGLPSVALSAQEMLSMLFAGEQHAMCVLDDAAHCYSLSDNWENFSGYTSLETRGDGFREAVAPDHLRKVLGCLAGGVSHAAVRFQLKQKDGQWKWCELKIANRPADAGSPHYICLLRDVTELVLTQGKFEKARLEAELAVRSRSEFLANMSHELRTPLNAILGFSQLIECGTYGDIGHPKYLDYIGNIQQSGVTLLSKINDLLQIAMIDSGHTELQETAIDLGEVLRHAIEFHSHRAFAAQITLRDLLPRQPIIVLADRIRMLQVFTNLLSNAIKYNRSGGQVNLSYANRPDGSIEIFIEDNGGGIQASHLSNILDAFGQDDSFFSRSRDCVGLGLALSKEIVKLHQGRIHIESETGKGTLLAIRLPKERVVNASAAAALAV